MHDMAMAVSHDLKFYVARIRNELFQINLIVSKRFLCLMTGTMKGGFEAGFIMSGTHPAATAATSRLDHHRVAEFPSDFHRFILCLKDSIAAGRYRHASFARSRTSSVLIPHGLHRTGGRPDELDVAAFTDFYEMRVL